MNIGASEHCSDPEKNNYILKTVGLICPAVCLLSTRTNGRCLATFKSNEFVSSLPRNTFSVSGPIT
jgi:hypothetical protein